MGYFSNGMEGDIYMDEYCNNCVHDENLDCPVWALHLGYNQEAANNKTHWLNRFIPYNDEGFNEKCKMYINIEDLLKNLKWEA